MRKIKTSVGFLADGDFDELIAVGAYVHIERMADGAFWMTVETKKDKHVIWLNAVNNRILGTCETE